MQDGAAKLQQVADEVEAFLAQVQRERAGYKVQRSPIDGLLYAVFKDSMQAEDFVMHFDCFDGCYVACFGGHDNAFCLNQTYLQ